MLCNHLLLNVVYPAFVQGGVDPRLWTAIVAATAYALPAYTFDLSPWLGVLNMHAPVEANTITIEVTGATGSDWLLASTLLVWCGEGHVAATEPPVVAVSPDMYKNVASECVGKDLQVSGACRVHLANRSMTAYANILVNDMQFRAFARYELFDYVDSISYNNSLGSVAWAQTTSYDAMWFMGLNNMFNHEHIGGLGSLGAPSRGISANVRTRKNAAYGTITHSHINHEWLNVGGVAQGAVFELSYNSTKVVPCVYMNVDTIRNMRGNVSTRGTTCMDNCCLFAQGNQRHYQRLLMVDVYDTRKPNCTIPMNATHSVVLHTSMNSDVETRGMHCMSWLASCAFCAPRLIEDHILVSKGVC